MRLALVSLSLGLVSGQGCPQLTCVMFCKNGIKKDSRGCDVCSCAAIPGKSVAEGGFDRDPVHGCVNSAGFGWCARMNQCVNPSVTDCPGGVEGVPTPAKPALGTVQTTSFTGGVQGSFQGTALTGGAVGSMQSTVLPPPAPIGSAPAAVGVIGSMQGTIGSMQGTIGSMQGTMGSTQGLLGGTVDSHGCRPSTGFTWCESKSLCLRPTDCAGIAPVGGTVDVHGCNPSTGYFWCATKFQCLRPVECSTVSVSPLAVTPLPWDPLTATPLAAAPLAVTPLAVTPMAASPLPAAPTGTTVTASAGLAVSTNVGLSGTCRYLACKDCRAHQGCAWHTTGQCLNYCRTDGTCITASQHCPAKAKRAKAGATGP